MYTNLYVYIAPRLYMSGKLYWRVKIDGKWTWRPADKYTPPGHERMPELALLNDMKEDEE